MFLSHIQSPTRKPDPSDVCEFKPQLHFHEKHVPGRRAGPLVCAGLFSHAALQEPNIRPIQASLHANAARGKAGAAGLSAGRDRHPLRAELGPGTEVSMQGPTFIWDKREILCILVFMQYSDFNSLQPSQGSSSPQHERSRQTPSARLPRSVSQCLPP